MAVVSMKQLLEAGVHFGHQTKRWNPKMKDYIYTERNGIHIVDLDKTIKMVEVAYDVVRDIASRGGKVLFVGTKKQAQASIKEEAQRCGEYYVSNRWLGGTLTNYETIKKRINRLKQLEDMEEDGTFELLPKKEVSDLMKERDKLENNLGGIKDMNGYPDVVFVVDVNDEAIAVHEANLLDIPVVAIVDTNCDPDAVDYVIPGNDDAIRSIKLIASIMADAVLEGKQGLQDKIESKQAEDLTASEGDDSDLDEDDFDFDDEDEDFDFDDDDEYDDEDDEDEEDDDEE